MSRRVLLAGLAAGILIRALALTWPGTVDVQVFKLWSFAATQGGLTTIYGVGGNPPERRVHEFNGQRTTVNYPPLTLTALAGAGHAYQAVTGGFANGPALTAAIKTLPLIADALAAWLLWWVCLQAGAGTSVAAATVLAWWLNPGALLHGAVLGYMDPLMSAPVIGAVAAAAAGYPLAAGVCAAAGMLTKPQAAVVMPAVAMVLALHAPRRAWVRAWLTAGAAAAATAAVVLLPYVAAGAWPNFLVSMASLTRHKDLSSFACNAWWIITYVMRAAYAVTDLGWLGAFGSPVRRALTIDRVIELGYPNPRMLGTLLVLAVMGWGLWAGRRGRGLAHAAALGAWCVLTYFVLGIAAHENHAYLVLPLIVLAAGIDRRWRTIAAVLTVTITLNLNVFYGLGDGIGFALPRVLLPPDVSVWLAVVNVAVLVMFGRRLAQSAPAPEGRPEAT